MRATWYVIKNLLNVHLEFKYRDVGQDGTVYGGPMYYLSKGLKERGFEKLGKIISSNFCNSIVLVLLLVGGNAAQSNTSCTSDG